MSTCDKKYKRLTKLPVTPPPDGEDKKNPYVYQLDYDLDLETVAIGFNGTDHTFDDTSTPKYLHNETWKQFFANSQPGNCLFNKCELLAAGCLYPYTATDNLAIGSSFPWTVTAKVDQTEGYNTTFCLKCTNAWDDI